MAPIGLSNALGHFQFLAIFVVCMHVNTSHTTMVAHTNGTIPETISFGNFTDLLQKGAC